MRIAILLALAMATIVTSGCSLCCPSYMHDYAGVGGKWQRSDPENGRVGSVFSDPGSVVMASNSAAVIEGESYYSDEPIYDDSIEYGESIMDTSDQDSDGVIILGEDWNPN